ncbi:MAG: ComF family protein [Pseudomonadota bacterium]
MLALKHGDRTALAKTGGSWMAQVLPQMDPDTVIVPIPLHWRRFLHRRYNQAALLANALAQETGLTSLPDGLQRITATKPLEGRTVDQRFADLENTIAVTEKWREALSHRSILLVDDVMTSGATFTAATLALQSLPGVEIDVIALARVAKPGEVS